MKSFYSLYIGTHILKSLTHPLLNINLKEQMEVAFIQPFFTLDSKLAEIAQNRMERPTINIFYLTISCVFSEEK